ncbi:SUN domain-containing ossification factor-like isoform X2 [Oncorhynchus clarkii lewisi]|uniref:SUN domain-containing ossification factor-like isoform X2 n=1 Tax=Oncorhynchus clarkii lewisi TaxID=490388 RepID=UPI0039B94836
MMKKRLWRVMSACLLVLLLCWHPTKYVSCTEQPPEAQTQSLKEDPGDRSHYKGVVQLEDGWGSQYLQHLSEEEVLPEGEAVETQQRGLAEEEGAGTPSTEVENKEHVQTLDLEDSEKEPETAEPEAEPETAEPEAEPETAEPEAEPETAEPEAEPETAEPEAEPETAEPETAEPETAEPETAEPETAETAEPEAEQPPPEPIVTQELQPTPTSDLFPLSSALNPVTEDPSMPHGSSSSVPEDTLSDVLVPEFSDTDLATDDCEAGETNPFDESWTCLSSGSNIQDQSPSLPVVLEKLNNAQGKGTKTDNTSHMLKERGLSSHIATEKDPNVATKDAEDIPTFDEWKKKIMEKENTLATHISTNGGSHAVKKVQKNFNNYASVECGAKILGSNPEAKSTSAILMESMDHYMLNPCSNKIWFIIELCDPIQVKQLDIANFELFSSTPKDFLVSISDRYPTNKWVKLGTFHAREERTVQSFPLDEHLYAKYVKVELVSHHGSEHFCPLSLIRVFGTSMVEEYEEIADPLDRLDDQDDDLDYPPGYVPAEDKASNDLIGSAKDVILNMVNNIKVNVLGGGPGEGNFSGQTVNLTVVTSSDPDTTTTLSPVPDAVEVEQPEVLEDPDVTTTEEPKPEHVTEEEQVVSPIEEEVQSIVTMLEEEEDGREREEQRCPGHRQQESLDYCGPSSSSSCSCSASLQEYLVHQCSFQRNYTSQERKPEATPAPVTPTTPSQQLPISPTPTQTPQHSHTQGEQPQEREPSSAHGEREARPTDTPPHLPWVETEAVEELEPSMELPHLEPSQTSTLPRPSSTDTSSSAARPTPAVAPPLHTLSKDLPGQKHPITGAEKSQEVQQGEIRQPPTVATSSSSGPVEQSWGTPVEERPCPEVQPVEQDNIPVIHQPHVADPLPPPLLTTSTPTEQQQPLGSPLKPAGAGGGNTTPEEQNSVPVVVMTEPPSHGHGQAVATETKGKAELVEDIVFTPSPNGNGQQLPRPTSFQPSSPSPLDFYAELHNATEQGNGNPMHGSTSQKESVFMRLNNRIKALEMNMSLSGRYLEQLSQRYRRQMEEMQRAFNQTIIKLQNTSRKAEEQDQRQTESIHSLQGQLEDVTQLVLNLSVRVSQLQSQVTDRQSYLLLCLVLCFILGLLLCFQHCRMAAIMQPPSTDPPITYSYCSPERRFSEYEDMSLKRRASYPLLHSDSFQLPTTEGAESLQTVEPINFPPANKKKRSKMKTVETLKSTAFCSPLLANRAPIYNGRGTIDPLPRTGHLRHPAFRDPPSEGSSEGSSQSDEPSFCGLAAATCTRLCDGLPPPRSRAEKLAFKPGRVDLLQGPRRDRSEATPTILTLQDLIGGEKELAAGRLGVMAL